MYVTRNTLRALPIQCYKIYWTSTANMSSSSALFSSASLKAANAQPYSSMKGKLDPVLLEALKDVMGFDFMTPVQSKVLSGLPTLRSDWYVKVQPQKLLHAQWLHRGVLDLPYPRQSCSSEDRYRQNNRFPSPSYPDPSGNIPTTWRSLDIGTFPNQGTRSSDRCRGDPTCIENAEASGGTHSFWRHTAGDELE